MKRTRKSDNEYSAEELDYMLKNEINHKKEPLFSEDAFDLFDDELSITERLGLETARTSIKIASQMNVRPDTQRRLIGDALYDLDYACRQLIKSNPSTQYSGLGAKFLSLSDGLAKVSKTQFELSEKIAGYFIRTLKQKEVRVRGI